MANKIEKHKHKLKILRTVNKFFISFKPQTKSSFISTYVKGKYQRWRVRLKGCDRQELGTKTYRA